MKKTYILKAVLKAFGLTALVAAGVLLLITMAALAEMIFESMGLSENTASMLTLGISLFIMLFALVLAIFIDREKGRSINEIR